MNRLLSEEKTAYEALTLTATKLVDEKTDLEMKNASLESKIKCKKVQHFFKACCRI